MRREEFVAYCPRCVLEHLRDHRPAYGHELWEQAWYIVCHVHRLPLLPRPRTRNPDGWTVQALRWQIDRLEEIGYQHVRTKPHDPLLTLTILEALLSLQRQIATVLAGERPAAYRGDLRAAEFLVVLQDVTSWSLSFLNPGFS